MLMLQRNLRLVFTFLSATTPKCLDLEISSEEGPGRKICVLIGGRVFESHAAEKRRDHTGTDDQKKKEKSEELRFG